MSTLTKVQRNKIFRAIAASQLDPAECEFHDSDDLETVIKHVSSGSVFSIELPDKAFRFFSMKELKIESRIGYEPPRQRALPDRFSSIIDEVSKWAKGVYEWVDIPDLWSLSLSGTGIPGESSPDSDNTPFARDEQTLISSQLKEIKESIKKTYELTAEQSAEIDKKFEEADKASQRMGRKDWGTFFGGIALSLVLADVITPDVMGHIFMLLEHAIGHLFGGPPTGGILSDGQD